MAYLLLKKRNGLQFMQDPLFRCIAMAEAEVLCAPQEKKQKEL
jgi:hypothetical protein